MPIVIKLSNGKEASFPDGTPEEKISKILDEDFPLTGEDVASGIKSDPEFKPTKDQYKLFEDWKEKQSSSFISGAIDAIPELAGKVGRGLMGVMDVTHWFSNGTNPLATLGEAGAQGAMQLYGLVGESTNPSSPAFELKNLIFNDGSLDQRYDQFLQARKYQKKLGDMEEGKDAALPGSKERANLKLANDLSILVDPTLLLGPVKGLALAGKLGEGALKAAEAVGKVESMAARLAGKVVETGADAVSGAGKAVSGVVEAGARKIGEGLDSLKIPGSAAGAAIGLGATQIPGIGTAAGVYAGAKGAQIGGELAGEAARISSGGASRLSILEQLASSPNLSGASRSVANALLPLDPVIQAGAAVSKGGLEGAVIGGGLGYYGSGTAEGTGQGAMTGAAMGAVGGSVGKTIEHLSGVGRHEAIANEIGKELSTLTPDQQPMAAKTFGRMMDQGQHEGVAELIDVRKWLGDKVDFRYVDNATAPEVFAKQFPGQKYVNSQGFAGVTESGKPAVFINADTVKPGSGFHESLHGAVRTAIGEQFGQKMADWAQSNLSPQKIQEYVGEYLNRASQKDQARLRPLLDTATPDGLRTVLEEISADSFSRFLRSSEHRDYLLRGKRDLGGIMVGLAKDTIGQLTDSLGKTDFRNQRGFERIAKELINAQRIIAREEIKSGPAKRPVDLSGLSGKDLEAWASRHGQVDTLKRDAQGNTIGVKTEAEVTAERAKIYNPIFDQMRDHAIKAGGSVARDGAIKVNRRMLEKYKATIPADTYKRALGMLDAKDAGAVMRWDTYFPKNEKLDKSNTSIQVNRQAETRSGVPYELELYRDKGFFVRILDYDKIMARADDYLGREGMLKPWNGSKMDALADLRRYINNLGNEASVPSAKLLGSAEKRDILYKIVGSTPTKKTVFENVPSSPNDRAEHQAKIGSTVGVIGAGNNTTPTVSLRLDRMGEHGPTGDKLGWTTGAYRKSQVNWNPAQKIGETEVITSDKGFKIVHGQKWRLYDGSEKLVGIYDSEGEAVKKAEARMNNVVDKPYKEKFTEGEITMDDWGENPYVYRSEYVDPKEFKDILKLEGKTYEQVVKMPTTEKYIEWYKEGHMPPPISVVIRQDGRRYATDRRRVIAALEAGVNRIPARVEIGRKSDFRMSK